MSEYLVPTEASIKELMGMVFGDGITVSPSADNSVADRHVATFINGDDSLVATCLCDLPFVAYSGGALSMIPQGAINEMITSKDIPESITDNFYEVMNIASKLFMNDGSGHLRLDKTMPPADSPDDVNAFNQAGTVTAFTIDIPQYGKGEISFVLSA